MIDRAIAIQKNNAAFIQDLLRAIKTRDPATLQPIILFSSMALSMGITFISSIITARMLGPVNYGDLKFIQTVWALLSLLITFGYFYSGSRVLVLENDAEKCREISGMILMVAVIMGIILAWVDVLIAFPLDYIFHTNVAVTMAQMAPLILVFPLAVALPLILQGVNKIYLLAVFSVAPTILYLGCILVLSRMALITTSSVLISQQLTTLVVAVIIIWFMKPSFRSFRYWWGELQNHNKTYGGPVYRGSLANVASDYINRLAISYWVNNTAVGYFSLASSLSEPLKLIPSAVATSSFRSFAKQTKISRKVILATVFSSAAALALAFLFFGKPLSWVYTTKFAAVGPMARVVMFAAIINGFGDFINRFLGAHGKGKSLRNAAYLVGFINAIGFFLLVPPFGAWGAILTTLIAGVVYFLHMYRSYYKFTHNISIS